MWCCRMFSYVRIYLLADVIYCATVRLSSRCGRSLASMWRRCWRRPLSRTSINVFRPTWLLSSFRQLTSDQLWVTILTPTVDLIVLICTLSRGAKGTHHKRKCDVKFSVWAVWPICNADLRFLHFQPDTGLHCLTTDMGLVHLDVPVYVLAFARTHCTYPWRDGQAELTMVTYLIRSPIQVLTKPSVK